MGQYLRNLQHRGYSADDGPRSFLRGAVAEQSSDRCSGAGLTQRVVVESAGLPWAIVVEPLTRLLRTRVLGREVSRPP